MSDDSVTLLSRRKFQQVVRDYVPLTYETFDPKTFSFRKPMHNLLKNQTRFWLCLSTAFRYFPPDSFTAVDVGTYPGSLLRLLHRLLPSDRCRLVGVGLMISEEFSQAMKSDCDAEMLTTNLDPNNEPITRKGYPTRISLNDGEADFVFALEVIEHLVSPSHLLGEALRILKPGGHLLITTPNVTRVGSVFKLLIGRSNWDRLMPIDYDCPEDEWRPHSREYTLAEVEQLFMNAGFEVLNSRHYLGRHDRYRVKSLTQHLIDFLKLPFYVIPHLRTNLLLVGRKPVGDSS